MNDELQPAKAVPETMKAVTKFTAEHAREVGLPSPEAVNYMMSIANMLLSSALITQDMALPDSEIGRLRGMGYTPEQITEFRDKYVRSNAMAKMLVGHEMSIDPMAALQDIDIVKGKIFVRYPQLIDQMIRKGFTVKWVERTNERAAIEVARPGIDAETFEFTIQDAKQAGLTETKEGKEGMYQKRPRVMLSARAASEAYRMTGGRGNVYTPEEKDEIFNSTTAEPSESDKKRAEVIAARDDMKVALKPKPEPSPVVEITKDPQPAQTEPITAQYAIHRVFHTGGGGERVIPTDEIRPKREEDANLRAQALANETNSPYEVVEVSASGEVQTKQRFNPPTRMPEKPQEKPQVEPEHSKPVIEPSEASDAKKALMARLNALAKTLALPIKTAGSRFNAFFAGWFGCGLKELPKDPAEYQVAVEELESCINADVNEFNSGPEEAGKRRARWAKEVRNFLDGQWPKNPETVALGCTLCRRWRLTPPQFKTWFESGVIALDFTPQEDGHAYIRLMLATPNLRSGADLLDWYNKNKLESGVLAAAVQQIEQRALKCSLEQAKEQDIDKAVKAWLLAAGEQTPKTAPPPKQEPPASTEDDGGGIFDELL